jgi:hypothetical protein
MVHRESENAWQVSDTEELKDAVWLPKSQIDDGGDALPGRSCEFLVPEWLEAQTKGAW